MVLSLAATTVSNARTPGSFTDTLIKFIFIIISLVVVIIGFFVIRFFIDPVGAVEGGLGAIGDLLFDNPFIGFGVSIFSPLAGLLGIFGRFGTD